MPVLSIDPSTIFNSVPTLDELRLDGYPDPDGYDADKYNNEDGDECEAEYDDYDGYEQDVTYDWG